MFPPLHSDRKTGYFAAIIMLRVGREKLIRTRHGSHFVNRVGEEGGHYFAVPFIKNPVWLAH